MNSDDLIRQWLEQSYVAKDASPQTIELRESQIKRLRSAVAPRDLWELTEDDLSGWLNSHGWGANTRIAARSALRSFYQWGRKRGHIAIDPTEEIAKPGSPQPRPRPVPNSVYASVLAEQSDPRIRVALRLSGELGLRRAEVAGLHRDHVIEDDDGYWLRFVGKGNKERTLPCPDDIATEVLALIASTPGDYAYTAITGGTQFARAYHPDKHLSPHWIGSLISAVLPDGYTMHKLRHRAGTEAYKNSGNDIYLASKLLGHSSVTTTAAYVKADMSRLRAAVSGASAK
jgi:integrase